MKTCHACGVVLTEQNFLSSRARRYDYICISCGKKRAKVNYYKNHDQLLVQKKKWYETNKERKTKFEREKYARLKLEVLTHYSTEGYPVCANPFGEHEQPYINLKALSIDHINGGGNKHLREIGQGKLYIWLKRNNYPSGFHVLCMNCQFIMKNTYMTAQEAKAKEIYEVLIP